MGSCGVDNILRTTSMCFYWQGGCYEVHEPPAYMFEVDAHMQAVHVLRYIHHATSHMYGCNEVCEPPVYVRECASQKL